MVRKYFLLMLVIQCCVSSWLTAGEEEYYRIINVSVSEQKQDSRVKIWKPAQDDLILEVSGMCLYDENRIAVATRKGEVWILGGVYDIPANKVTYKKIAEALHDPLGLIKVKDGLITVQRSEMTKLIDNDGDEVIDEYRTLTAGWGVTGHYHEYAYGPELDKDGNLWMTLNTGLNLPESLYSKAVTDPVLGYHQAAWRGWGLKLTPEGELKPVCAGMRSPCGIGSNRAGDMFYTDQQGNWVASNSLHQMREGVFFHHAETLASQNLPGSTIHGVTSIPEGLSYPEVLKKLTCMKPPAVWLPYRKVGQSATDVMLEDSKGKFGPFDGQLLIGEFTQASINRVYLEKVKGEYQGACFPFRAGFGSAVLRLEQGKDGSVFAGLTNRGWSSLGTMSHGLQRLVWTGKTPFEMLEIHALKDGFEIVFTEPVNPLTVFNLASWKVESFTYNWQSAYGSDEILKKQLTIKAANVSADGKKVKLTIDGLRECFVHEISAVGLRNKKGQRLLHDTGWYTLNHLP